MNATMSSTAMSAKMPSPMIMLIPPFATSLPRRERDAARHAPGG
jgi:hypothetical protein